MTILLLLFVVSLGPTSGLHAQAQEEQTATKYFVSPAALFDQEIKQHGSYSKWYQAAVDYWENGEASDLAVMGGYEHLLPIDIEGSRRFMLKVLSPMFTEAKQSGHQLVVADCGAGVSRVTRQLLQYYFHEVDIIEPSANLLYTGKRLLEEQHAAAAPTTAAAPPTAVAAAPTAAAAAPAPAPARSTHVPAPLATRFAYYQAGLQEHSLERGRYDVLWVQGCLLHLTDDDMVGFLQNATAALKPGGFMIVKENEADHGGAYVDRTDSSVAREPASFARLYENGGWDVIDTAVQQDYDPELTRVRMWALYPKAWRKGVEGPVATKAVQEWYHDMQQAGQMWQRDEL